MNRLVKFGVGAASSAILLATFAATTFAADLTIDGNGGWSDNSIKVDTTCTTNVTQNSNTTVGATIYASSSTGGNVASGNTGNGDVSIGTGDATTAVAVVVTGGSNTASVPSCCCGGHEENANTQSISGNALNSKNKIDKKSHNSLTIRQRARTTLGLGVTAKAKTGKNKAKDNTGDGDVSVETGASSTVVGVEVTGGENTL